MFKLKGQDGAAWARWAHARQRRRCHDPIVRKASDKSNLGTFYKTPVQSSLQLPRSPKTRKVQACPSREGPEETW